MPVSRKKTPVLELPADGWTSVAKASRVLGVAYATVVGMALRQELESKTVDGRVFVSCESVIALRDKRAGVRRVG